MLRSVEQKFRRPTHLHEEGTIRRLVRLRCARHADEVVAFWLKTMRDETQPLALRLSAAQQIADRGLGKPQQQIDWNVVIDRKLEALTPAQLRQLRKDYVAANPMIEHKPEEELKES